MSFVNFCVAILLKELLSLLLHFLGHKARTLGPNVKQDEAALQYVWERPGLKDNTGINKEAFAKKKAMYTCTEGAVMSVCSTDISLAWLSHFSLKALHQLL